MYYVFEMTYIKFISMLVYKYFVAKLVIILAFFVPFFSLSTHTFMKNKQPFQLRERERERESFIISWWNEEKKKTDDSLLLLGPPFLLLSIDQEWLRKDRWIDECGIHM